MGFSLLGGCRRKDQSSAEVLSLLLEGEGGDTVAAADQVLGPNLATRCGEVEVLKILNKVAIIKWFVRKVTHRCGG